MERAQIVLESIVGSESYCTSFNLFPSVVATVDATFDMILKRQLFNYYSL